MEHNLSRSPESGIAVIGGGHYATETVGVKLVMQRIQADRFGMRFPGRADRNVIPFCKGRTAMSKRFLLTIAAIAALLVRISLSLSDASRAS